MYTYKNISGRQQVITGVGTVEPDGTLQSEKPFYNKNFQLVGGGDNAVSAVAENKQPGQVTQAEKVEDQK